MRNNKKKKSVDYNIIITIVVVALFLMITFACGIFTIAITCSSQLYIENEIKIERTGENNNDCAGAIQLFQKGIKKAVYNRNIVIVEAKDYETNKSKQENVKSMLPYIERLYNERDCYLLAKIAMAEAEECSIETKVAVIATVINRSKSDMFPNEIRDIIYEEHNGVFQFSPIGNGRWAAIEPNKECYEAVSKVLESQNCCGVEALYFENCKNKNNWHSRNLTFLFEKDGIRFYK